MKKRKAYSYIRMSTDNQIKGDSLRRQLEASKKYALENNLEFVNEIDGYLLEDIGLSAFDGTNLVTGVLSIFLDHLKNGKIERGSVLIVESLDRLSRAKVTNALKFFMEVVGYGIEIVTLTDNQRYTEQSLNENPSQLFISLGVMLRAYEESETKSIRIKAAWASKRNNAKTKPITSIAPAWLKYSKNESMLLEIPERSDVVRKIFELCAYTCGQNSIVKYLNQHNVPVFGKAKYWHLSYVKKILKNRAVLGEFQPYTFANGRKIPSGNPIPDYFPRIIDDELFNRAQLAISRRRISGAGRKGRTFTNLFSGLLHCGKCQNTLSIRHRSSKNKNVPKTLICNSVLVGYHCDAPEWSYSAVETSLLTHLNEINFDEILNSNNDQVKEIDELEDLRIQLKQAELARDNLLSLVSQTSLSPDAIPAITKRINDNEQIISSINKRINELNSLINQKLSVESSLQNKELKRILKILDDKNEDYYFRSSLNQLLHKTISRIDLFPDTDTYSPWEIDQNDRYVKKFYEHHPEFLSLDFDSLLNNKTFETYWINLERRIRVTYKTGLSKTIFLTKDYSMITNSIPNNLRD